MTETTATSRPRIRWGWFVACIVRRANASSAEAIRAQIQDFEDRVAAEWASATPDDLAEKKAETVRLTDEFTKRVVDEAERE
jgi:hypothetical protein